VLFNDRMQGLLKAIWNHLSTNLSAPLNDSHHNHFVLNVLSLSGNPSRLYALVHVSSFPANVSFIGFYFSTTSSEFAAQRLILQCKPDAMKHEPCRFLSHANSPGNFVGANAIAAVGKHPDYDQPLLQRNRRVLEYGSNFCGELAFCVRAFALPLALIVQENNILAATRRAGNDAIRPTKNGHVGQSVIRIGEINHCILQSLWLVGFAFHAVNIGYKR